MLLKRRRRTVIGLLVSSRERMLTIQMVRECSSMVCILEFCFSSVCQFHTLTTLITPVASHARLPFYSTSPKESEPMDDRDWDSHHTHHKSESVPLDDRDFDSHHEHTTYTKEEMEIEPMDDRDFDSHHVPDAVHPHTV